MIIHEYSVALPLEQSTWVLELLNESTRVRFDTEATSMVTQPHLDLIKTSVADRKVHPNGESLLDPRRVRAACYRIFEASLKAVDPQLSKPGLSVSFEYSLARLTKEACRYPCKGPLRPHS